MTISAYRRGNHICMSPPNETCFREAGVGMLLGATLVAVASSLFTTVSNLSGSTVIAGNGPELQTIEQLTRAFEEANPEIGVEIRWDRNSKPIEAVESGVADIGVTGQAHAGLVAVAIAWDGIAVIVNEANPVKEVSREQLAAM